MVEDSSTRTVPVKLDVDESAAELLHQTIGHFLDAANYVVDVAWEPDWKITSKQKLHDRTYYDVRDDSPLPANLVQAARNRAAEAVKGVVERWKDGKNASKPHFTSWFASYDARTVTVNEDHATLATIDGRVTAEKDTSVKELARTMGDEGIGDLIIVDDDKPVGIVTDRDIALEVGRNDDFSSLTANDLMAEDLVTIQADAEAVELPRKMAEGKVRRLPVVNDDGTLQGIATLDDVVATVGEELDDIATVIEAQSPEYSPSSNEQ